MTTVAQTVERVRREWIGPSPSHPTRTLVREMPPRCANSRGRGRHLHGGADVAKATCSIDGCDSPRWARGWCGKHLWRWRKYGDPNTVSRIYHDDEARFWSYVDKRGDDECWPWTGSKERAGYGFLRISDKHTKAHRFAYELLVGAIPDGLDLDHTCHTREVDSCPGGYDCPHRACVNPAHLEPVTNEVNIARGKRAQKTHCRHGHPFSGDNLVVYESPDGSIRYRSCRECRRRWNREYRARQKERGS